MDIREYAYEGRWWRSTTGFTAISKDEHYDSDENVVIEAGEEVSTHFEVCYVCDGRGAYVNPSIDSHGISGEEMAELGYEFKDDYLSGVYDITCSLCEGTRVIPVPNTPSHKSAIEGESSHPYSDREERAAEARAMGLGY